jgi:proline dehydrogenase
MSFFRSTFIALSDAKVLRSFAENSPLAKRVSGRFIAGTTLSEVLSVVEEMNSLGISVTMDALGENVSTEAAARRAADLYHDMLEKIASLKLDSNISLKLTQMGMDLGNEMAESIVGELAQHAAECKTFLRVDMEGTPYTQATLDMVRRLHARPSLHDSIGVVVQAYLFRTEMDVDQLLSEGVRLRLCKGAYREPADLAFPRKDDVDRNYVLLAKKMLKSRIFHGLATHDETIIDEIKQFVKTEAIDPKSFEFQMLYGIRRDLQESLVKEGYRVRAYIPFGGEWYPYFMRRLAERPANVLFIAKNMLR